MNITSPHIPAGGTIPERYTCEGADMSPPLHWSDVPAGTAELALVVEDPDAARSPFTHWLVWGIDPDVDGIEVGQVPAGAREGRNDFGRIGYGGACPPRGRGPHHYRFRVLALSEPSGLHPGAGPVEFRDATHARILDEAAFVATFARA